MEGKANKIVGYWDTDPNRIFFFFTVGLLKVFKV